MHPVEDVLRKKFGRIKLAAHGWVRIPCPTCTPHDAKKYKRYVSMRSLFTKCYICNQPLSFFELTGKDIKPDPTLVEEKKEEHPWAKKIPCLGDPIPIHLLPKEHPVIQFLNKDYLFDIDYYSKELGMVFIPVDKGVVFNRAPWTTSAERLVFPVHMKGELVGWQMRSIPGTFYGNQPGVIKYYHLFDKGQTLYNFDRARQCGMVILVEGVKKALKFPNGVASFGKNLSEMQIQLLQLWSKITIMLDGEEDTQQYATELVKQLGHSMSLVRNVDLRKYGFVSPDDVPAERLHQIVYEIWKPTLI